MCGGTCCWAAMPPTVLGLSPRVRGNRRQGYGRLGRLRSIPACAGEPLSTSLCFGFCKVYPRVCGGTWYRRREISTEQGLSPRVRGNLNLPGQLPAPCGSIPACAGEPLRGRGRATRMTVYPRVCGGTATMKKSLRSLKGLSPRVRGNPESSTGISSVKRSIPACAGEPPACSPVSAGLRVYPRVCGGTVAGACLAHKSIGLSPRVRGNPDVLPAARRYHGSIPACAGEPGSEMSNQSMAEVYPRVCGGTALLLSQIAC